MLAAILICAFMVKNVATQRTANATLGTKSCVLIGHDVKLLCTVSADCCTSLQRVWEKGSAITLLDDGESTLDPSKYEEDFDNGTTGFNLIIKNVQTSDFGVNYKCLYGATESAPFYLDDILCTSNEVNESGNCWECAGQNYGWSILGTVLIGTALIVTVIFMIIAKAKICKTKTVWIVGVLTFIISVVLNIPIAVLIGYLVCHCDDGTDPLLILLGLVTSGTTCGIATYKLKEGSVKLKLDPASGSSQESNGSSCWPPCKVEQEPKNPKKPSSNEQPLKENKKKKPAAEKSSNEHTLEKKKKKKSAAETGSNEPSLEKKKKKKSVAETGSRSPTSAAKHIKTANNETEMIPTEKGFSGDLEKKRPLPPLTTQLSPTNRPLPLPSSTKPLSSSTRPLPQITTNKGDN